MYPSVRLVTSADFPELAVDDRELLVELRSRGVPAHPAVWDDPDVDWAEPALCVLRSVYDYHLRRDEFLQWVDRVSETTVLLNDPETVRWNSHKSYLTDLAMQGVPVIDTVWLPAGERPDLRAICRQREWSRAVVKPAVSASAYRTLAFDADECGDAQRHAEALVENGDAMVQPYLGYSQDKPETHI